MMAACAVVSVHARFATAATAARMTLRMPMTPTATCLRDRRRQFTVFVAGNGLGNRPGFGAIHHDALLDQRLQASVVYCRAQHSVSLKACIRAGAELTQRDSIVRTRFRIKEDQLFGMAQIARNKPIAAISLAHWNTKSHG